jgi:Arc/MetJ-type ribon-helix-helix transcriptional regulator
MTKVHKHFVIPEELDIELRHYCADRREAMSNVIKEALRYYLDKQNEKSSNISLEGERL